MGNADETRRRLLEAATAEFAANGIAGARVDRIAANAGCNKQAIYAYFESKDGLFEAVYSLYSIQRKARLRLKVPMREDDVTLPSMVSLWKGLDWFEREAYDMFGFRFDGHPNLRRILCHEAFQGHPLRKDYDPARRWILTEDKIYKPHFDLPETGDEMFERMTINIGPSHPAMHGTFRLMALLDGDEQAAVDGLVRAVAADSGLVLAGRLAQPGMGGADGPAR